MSRVIAGFVLSFLLLSVPAGTQSAARQSQSTIQMDTLLQTETAWDGSSYPAYPQGTPQLSVLKISIPAHTTMDWHSHPIANAAYVASGEITVEKQDGSATRHFTRGQVIAEIVNGLHRGITGDRPVELIVFYAGASGLPLSQKPSK